MFVLELEVTLLGNWEANLCAHSFYPPIASQEPWKRKEERPLELCVHVPSPSSLAVESQKRMLLQGPENRV